MTERVTIVFHNMTREKLSYNIWGWAGAASGQIGKSGICSGQQNTFVVSGYDEYQFTVDPHLHNFTSAPFKGDSQISLVFGATS